MKTRNSNVKANGKARKAAPKGPKEPKEFDRIALDIIENALRNARNEMDAVLFRSAMSPVIREQHDGFPMICTPDGRMVAFVSVANGRRHLFTLLLSGGTPLQLTRRLYGGRLFDIPHARSTLSSAFIDLLICDCVAISAARALQAYPGQASVWSAAAKYFVPATVEQVMRDLSVVLGARFFLRDGHPWNMFQKMVRDSSIVSVVDGSAMVQLHALGLQLEQLATELSGRVRVAKLNTDENPITASRFGVRSIPTLLVLKDGKEIDRLVGAVPKQEILRTLEAAI